MTNESLQVSPDNKNSVLIGCLPVMEETFPLNNRGKIAFHGIFSTINYVVNWFRAILHNIRCLLTVRMLFRLMASIWTLQLIQQTSNNSIVGKCKQITTVSWLNKKTYIHLCLPLLLRQDGTESRGRRPAQGIGVHLIPAWVSPQAFHVPLNQSLSSDQHDPRSQWERPMSSRAQNSEAPARVDRR